VNILISDGMGNEGVQKLESAGFSISKLKDKHNPNEIQIVIVRSRFCINETFLNKYANVRLVAKLGTGLDNIDVVLCRNREIKVINAPGLNANATAEFTLGMMISIVKKITTVNKKVLNKDFRRSMYYGRELKLLNVGIIGYGNIGKLIHEKVKFLVKNIMIYSRRTDFDNSVSLDTLLKKSDVVILALSLTGNEKIVNEDFLNKCKEDVLLMNIARGALVCEKTLIDHLRKNEKFQYYTDVLEKEPNYSISPKIQNYENKLFAHNNFIYTPHIAGMTTESQRDISNYISEKIIKEFIHE